MISIKTEQDWLQNVILIVGVLCPPHLDGVKTVLTQYFCKRLEFICYLECKEFKSIPSSLLQLFKEQSCKTFITKLHGKRARTIDCRVREFWRGTVASTINMCIYCCTSTINPISVRVPSAYQTMPIMFQSQGRIQEKFWLRLKWLK